MTANRPAFEVDKRGLEKILARRGKEFAILELVQNALDENVTQVNVGIGPIEGSRGYHMIEVGDDSPEGFADLSHAYTLFAESAKKVNPEQRGRFNLGEKLVLACCRKATITTTTGTIEWDGDTRTHSRKKTDAGSFFRGELRMNRDEAQEAVEAVRRVLVPEGVTLLVNGLEVVTRPAFRRFEATLPTEVADADGFLRRTKRKTFVALHFPQPGEVPTIFEMGIPVVESEGAFHVDVLQKVPLNTDRDNVTPGYLRALRALVLNAAHEHVPDEDARGAWVDDALESDLLEAEAVDSILTARYGEARVVRDPSDPEGTKLAASKGYAVIEPRSFNRRQWDTIRSSGAVLPAGKVTPGPKPYSAHGEELTYRPREEWTPGMLRFEAWATVLARALVGVNLEVRIASKVTWAVAATWGRGGELCLNLGRLGHRFFDEAPGQAQLQLLIHEMGHEKSGDHLSDAYHDALCEIGAKLAALVVKDPGILSAK